MEAPVEGDFSETAHTVRASDGYPLAATRFSPAAPSGGAILVGSGTAVRRTFYGRFARFLAARGHPVVTFDYRGIGDSRPPRLRGFPARLRDWGEQDLAAMIEWTSRYDPGDRIILVGHSMGGQLLGLAPNADRVSALVGVAAQSGWWGHWPGARRYALALLWYLAMPGLAHLVGFFPGRRLGVGEDLPRHVALEWARWGRNPQYMIDEDGAPLRPHFSRFEGRILAYSFSDDGFAPRPAVDALMGFYGRARVDHRHVEPRHVGLDRLGHFGFFRADARPTLWEDTAAWLREVGRSASAPESYP